MSSTRWQLFRLLGIPINVDVSWLMGIVSLKDLLGFLDLKLELESEEP